MTIAGVDYDYVLCPRCGIWIQEAKYKTHKNSPECDKWYKNRHIREAATRKVLIKINTI